MSTANVVCGCSQLCSLFSIGVSTSLIQSRHQHPVPHAATQETWEAHQNFCKMKDSPKSVAWNKSLEHWQLQLPRFCVVQVAAVHNLQVPTVWPCILRLKKCELHEGLLFSDVRCTLNAHLGESHKNFLHWFKRQHLGIDGKLYVCSALFFPWLSAFSESQILFLKQEQKTEVHPVCRMATWVRLCSGQVHHVQRLVFLPLPLEHICLISLWVGFWSECLPIFVHTWSQVYMSVSESWSICCPGQHQVCFCNTGTSRWSEKPNKK